MAKKVPTIVVIDDSPTSISLYEHSAAPLKVNLKTFLSPKESLDFLAKNDVDLVFLDIVMREMDGLTVLSKIREMLLLLGTTVVMVTSKDYAQDRQTAKQLGAREFVVKPIRPKEIRNIICKYTNAASVGGDATGK